MSSFSLFLTDSPAPFAVNEPVIPHVPQGKFSRLSHLAAAEDALDALAAQGLFGTEYLNIEARVKEYIKEHPELLNAAWSRNGGAVYDLIQAARESLLLHQEAIDIFEQCAA
jgi:hypothetical protein